MSLRDEMDDRRPGLALAPGARVAFDDRLWTVSRCTAAEVELSRKVPSGAILDPEITEQIVVISAAEFFASFQLQGELFWADGQAQSKAKGLTPKDRVRWHAQLAIVNCIQTGYLWGYPLGGQAALIPEIEANPSMPITSACELVQEWLKSDHADARRLVHNLNSKAKRESGIGEVLSFDPPSTITLYRWQRDLYAEQDVAAVIDRRGLPRQLTDDRAIKKANAEALAAEVLAERTEADSALRDVTIIEEIKERALARGLSLGGETSVRDIVKRLHNAAGRTPAKVSTSRGDRDRSVRGVTAPSSVGLMQAWDATTSDVMVRRTHHGRPFRAHIHVSVDVTTGLITSLYATGRYSAANVMLLAYDAFRPIIFLPTREGEIGRFKAKAEKIYISDEIERRILNLPEDDERGFVLKPGFIPARIRADNARQNSAMAMITAMRLMKASFTPSKVGMKTNNAAAENAIGIASNLLEKLPGYIGRSTVQRGRRPDEDLRPMLMEHLNAELMERVMLEHNAAPCTAPAFRGTGVSRLEAWDELTNLVGEPPKLTDPREWFRFLPRKTATLSKRSGLSVEGDRYDDAQLRKLPTHLIDGDGRVELIYDPRRPERIWIPDDREGRIFEIENVLNDYMDGPLVRSLRRACMVRAGLPDAKSIRNMMTLSRYLEQMRDEPGTAVAIERDLADWAIADRVATESIKHMPDGFISKINDAPSTQPSVGLDLDRELPLPELRR